jgi:hypothetical protein
MTTAIAFTDYLAIDAVNWTTLKEMRRSPLHYKHRLAHARPDTSPLRAGRSAHTAVFEPDRFMLDYAVFKGKTRRGKAWEEFLAAHPGQTILTVKEYATALAYRDAVRKSPLASPYLATGEAEKAIEWTDPETGLRCKARLDFLSTSRPAIVDLKGSATIAYGAFIATAYRMGYHCQLGLYQWGVKEALGLDLPVVVIPVEANAPHDVGAFPYGEPELEAGLNEARSMLVKLAYHLEKNDWPGQYDEEQVIEFPAWVTRHEDENLTDLGLED